MKKLLFLLVLAISFNLSAATTSLESCLSQTDKLDREYCQKKRLRNINKKFEKDFSTYRAGYSQAQKNVVMNKLNADITAKKAQIEQLKKELKVSQTNLGKVKNHLSNEEHATNKKNSRREKRKKKTRKLKKLFKKIF